MRILYLNHNVAGTGTYQRASNFARVLARSGHQVTLVTTDPRARLRFARRVDGGYTELRAPDLFWGPARTGWDPWNTLRRTAALRLGAFDIVHAFDSRPAVILPALSVRRRTGAPLFLDWADWWGHGGRIRERSGWLVRTAFGPVETWFEEAFRTTADGTTVISRALEGRALGLGVRADRVWRIPNGCAELPALSRRAARSRLGIAEGTPLVVHVGVLTAGDMAQLGDTVRFLRKRRPEARIVLVGSHRAPAPGDLLASGALQRTGFVPVHALRAWLAAADLCVVAMADTVGNRGRWPGRINDYFSAGRPTVLPRVGDVAELVERHGAGWVSDPDPAALAATLDAALADPEGREAAGRRAAGLAAGPLAWEALARIMESAYNSTLSGGFRPAAGRNHAVHAGTTRNSKAWS